MWLFDPSSPCIAIFNRLASNLHILASLGNLAPIQGNLLKRRLVVRITPKAEALPGATGERPMLWTIIVVLFILWLLGFSLHFGGGLIHILLVLAIIVLIYNLITGRRAV
jgi:hypothetical protein